MVEIRAASAGDEVLVSVQDDGPGVPAEAREAIFNRFHSIRPEEDFGRHSGLGLAIAKAIVEGHGGRIEVEDRADGRTGARFLVRFPGVDSMSAPSLSSETVHASAVAIGGQRGADRRPARPRQIRPRLAADRPRRQPDQRRLYLHPAHRGARPIASAPPTILGKIEMRGVGLVELETEQDVPVALFVDLDEPPDAAARAGRGADDGGRADPDDQPGRAGGVGADQGGDRVAADRAAGRMRPTLKVVSFAYARGDPPPPTWCATCAS